MAVMPLLIFIVSYNLTFATKTIGEDFYEYSKASGINVVAKNGYNKPSKAKTGHETIKSFIPQIFTAFLKLTNSDSNKIAAVGVNTLIFLAQLLGTSLISNKKAAAVDEKRNGGLTFENSYDFIVNISGVAVSDVFHDKIGEKIISYIREHSSEEESGCVQLLICKLIPFFKSMQRALKDVKENRQRGRFNLFYHFPKGEEIAKQNENCANKIKWCSTN
ncbi:uncharacterized protein [Euwallacea similis]|uniref:uncharacterized protein n=1 Tax=Euwallacea similis TaxID=1736056 RepID=UPI0034510A1C